MGMHSFGSLVIRTFADRLSPDDAILSYHDTRLSRADYVALKGDWLTDNIIAFWEDFLEHEKMVEFPRSRVVLLRPSISHLLLRTPTPEVRNLGSALPDLTNTTHMFLTINDNTNSEAPGGGSHWSLLVVSLLDRVAFHYDSLHSHNLNDAQLLTHHLSIVSGRSLRMMDIDATPQQLNGNDCGVFVCLMMQHLLLGRLLSNPPDNLKPINMSLSNTEIDAAAGRKEIMRIIDARRKEAQKMRSRSKSPNGSRSQSPPRIGDD